VRPGREGRCGHPRGDQRVPPVGADDERRALGPDRPATLAHDDPGNPAGGIPDEIRDRAPVADVGAGLDGSGREHGVEDRPARRVQGVDAGVRLQGDGQ
jgi:hypothetical protein